MKSKLSFIITSSFFCLLVSGCGEDFAAPEADSERVPILFSVSSVSSSMEAETLTRAATTDFPHNGKIAILAANAEKHTTNLDWNDLYLDHAAANAGAKNGNKYPITLETGTQYWPFDGDKYLSFAAYSPASARTANAHTLTVTATAQTPFPDLLYSTRTSVYNKVTGAAGVELTEFKHAMARVVIKVIPVNKEGDEISDYVSDNFKITKLNIQTKTTTGTFDFLTGIPAWTLPAPGSDFVTVYNLINASSGYGDTKAQKLPYDSDKTNIACYLLPLASNNTLELSKVGFQVSDKAYSYTYASGSDGSLDEFKNESNGSITLEMGKTTVLTIKVKVMDIQNGGESNNILLYGTLKDWEYKGNSTVTIN